MQPSLRFGRALVSVSLFTACMHQGGIQHHFNEQEEALHHAASSMHASQVEKLLKDERVDKDSQDNDGFTALMNVLNIQCKRRDVKHVVATVRTLLDKQVRLNLRNNNGWTALMFAARTGHTDVIPLLLARGAQINLINNKGETALMIAAQSGRLAIVQALLKDKSLNPDITAEGRTALMLAVINNKPQIVKALLGDVRVAAGLRDNEGLTALLLAAQAGYYQVVRAIVSRHRGTAREAGCALLLAAQAGQVAVVKYLLRNCNMQAEDGKMAYALAQKQGYAAVTALLQDYQSFPVHEVNRAFLQAAEAGEVIRVRALLQVVVDPNVQDRYGQTALMKATAQGHNKVVALLSATPAAANSPVVPTADRQDHATPLSAEASHRQAAAKKQRARKKKQRARKKKSQQGGIAQMIFSGGNTTFTNSTFNQYNNTSKGNAKQLVATGGNNTFEDATFNQHNNARDSDSTESDF